MSPSSLEFLLSNISLQTILVILEVVLIIPFIIIIYFLKSTAPVFNLIYIFFSPYKCVHCNYGLVMGSLKSLCCGNIFFNSMPCVFSFLFIEEQKYFLNDFVLSHKSFFFNFAAPTHELKY